MEEASLLPLLYFFCQKIALKSTTKTVLHKKFKNYAIIQKNIHKNKK